MRVHRDSPVTIAMLLLYVLAALLVLVDVAAGQTASADRLSVGGSKLRPDASTTVRLDGLATTGGTFALFTDGDGDVSERVLVNGDLPVPLTIPGVISASGTTGLPTGTAGSVWLAGGFGTPNAGRMFFGDGTGWKFHIASRVGGTTTDRVTFSDNGRVEFGQDALPLLGYSGNLGALDRKWLTLHAAELWVETLVAQNTLATIGGRVLVGPTTPLIADVSAGATTIDVKYNNLASGDRVYLEANGKVEFLAITSGASAITGGFRYSVTRNLDGSGADTWAAGDAVFNTGSTGSGFIDLYSVRGVKAGSEVGPTIVGNVRLSSTYNDWAPRWAIGQLNGLYGIATSTYGAAFGDPSDVNTLITATSWKLRDGTTDKFSLDGATGNLSLTGNLTVSGSGAFVGSGITIDSTGIASAVPSGAVADGNSFRFAFNANGMTAGGLYAYTDATNNVLMNRMTGVSASDNYRVELVAQNEAPTGAGTVTSQLLSGPTGLQWSASVNDGAGASNSLELTKADLYIDGVAGQTQTVTVRNSAGTGTCTLIFTQGIKTGGTC